MNPIIIGYEILQSQYLLNVQIICVIWLAGLNPLGGMFDLIAWFEPTRIWLAGLNPLGGMFDLIGWFELTRGHVWSDWLVWTHSGACLIWLAGLNSLGGMFDLIGWFEPTRGHVWSDWLVWTHSGACFIINFTSLSPAPSLAEQCAQRRAKTTSFHFECNAVLTPNIVLFYLL